MFRTLSGHPAEASELGIKRPQLGAQSWALPVARQLHRCLFFKIKLKIATQII